VNAYKRLGELMMAKGLLTEKQIDEVAKLGCLSKLRFGQILVLHGYMSDTVVASCLAEQFDLPMVDPMRLKVNPEALALVSHDEAIKNLFLPVDLTDEVLAVAVSDPIDLELTDKIAKKTGRRLMLAIAAPTTLQAAIDHFYGKSGLVGVTSKKVWAA